MRSATCSVGPSRRSRPAAMADARRGNSPLSAQLNRRRRDLTNKIITERTESSVKRCETFTGTGDVPSGRYLYIVVQSNPLDGNIFYFNKANPDGHGHWTARDVRVGGDAPEEEGTPYPVLAVTFNEATSREIDSRRYENGGTELFPDASTHDQISVVAGADRTPC